jgi:hypothetical protein
MDINIIYVYKVFRRGAMNKKDAETKPQDESNDNDFSFKKLILVIIIAAALLIVAKFFM